MSSITWDQKKKKNHNKRWSNQNIQKSMNTPPKINEIIKIKQVNKQKGFIAKAVLAMQTCRADLSSPSRIPGGRGPAISTGQTQGGQLQLSAPVSRGWQGINSLRGALFPSFYLIQDTLPQPAIRTQRKQRKYNPSSKVE